MEYSLKLKQLNKSYSQIKALNDISYEFKTGIYGILGPNGAGKSTLVNIISRIIEPDNGDVLYCDKVTDYNFLNHLGFMPQGQEMYAKFKVNEFMYYMASLKNMKTKLAKKEIPELLKVVGLSAYKNYRIDSLSGGMKQRLLIAQALLNNPRVLIFDEPTAGLDPSQRIEIRNFLATLSKDHIVIVTTHVVSDVESIADEILLMKKGIIIKSGSPEELCSSINSLVKEIVVNEADLKNYQELHYRIVSKINNKRIIRVISDIHFEEEQLVYPSLEDVYLYYVGE